MSYRIFIERETVRLSATIPCDPCCRACAVLGETKLTQFGRGITRAFEDPFGGFVTGVTVVTSRAVAGRTCGCCGARRWRRRAVRSSSRPQISSSMYGPRATNALLHALPDRESIALERFNSASGGMAILPSVAAQFERRRLCRHGDGDRRRPSRSVHVRVGATAAALRGGQYAGAYRLGR